MQLSHWQMFGIYCGYPQCCRDAFEQCANSQNYDRPYINPFHGSGFVACESCAKREMNDVMKEINDHRFRPYPFINDKTPTLYYKKGRKLVCDPDPDENVWQEFREFLISILEQKDGKVYID
jgi:hypothetical protein